MENIVNIHIRFIDKNSGKGIYSEQHNVKLYDKDLIKDDFLGESSLDERGHGIVSITRDDFRSADSPNEKYPDIYFELYEGDNLLMKSKVFKNLKIEEEPAYPASDGIHFDLGTFTI